MTNGSGTNRAMLLQKSHEYLGVYKAAEILAEMCELAGMDVQAETAHQIRHRAFERLVALSTLMPDDDEDALAH
jgi:hypothetical protein